MTASRKAREVIDALSPHDRETHALSVLSVELLADLADQVGELVRLGRGDTITITATTTAPAGTRKGAGRPVGDPVSGDVEQESSPVHVALTEPALPADTDRGAGAKPAPSPTPKSAPTPKAAPAKRATKAAAGRPSVKE